MCIIKYYLIIKINKIKKLITYIIKKLIHYVYIF